MNRLPRPRLLSPALALACALLAAGAAQAQVEIDKRRPAPPDGEVRIENPFGSVVVQGWERNEVRVTGRLAAGAEGLDLDGDEEGVDIDVDVPESWFFSDEGAENHATTLKIWVPAGSQVEVETVEASVEIVDVTGPIEVETVQGAVRVRGGSPAVEIETMTGAVEVDAGAAEMSIETTSGDVTLRGAVGHVEVESVTGAIDVTGSSFHEVDLETVSGDITLRGSLAAGEADVEIASHEGIVTLELPSTTKARFELRTFAGSIRNDLGPPPSRGERSDPFLHLRFSTGLGESEVRVETFQSDIRLTASDR